MKPVIFLLSLSILFFSCGEKGPIEKALDNVQDQMYYKAKYSAISYSDFNAENFTQHYLNDTVVFCIQSYSYKDDGIKRISKTYGYFLLLDGYAEDITQTPDYYTNDKELNKIQYLIK